MIWSLRFLAMEGNMLATKYKKPYLIIQILASLVVIVGGIIAAKYAFELIDYVKNEASRTLDFIRKCVSWFSVMTTGVAIVRGGAILSFCDAMFFLLKSKKISNFTKEKTYGISISITNFILSFGIITFTSILNVVLKSLDALFSNDGSIEDLKSSAIGAAVTIIIMMILAVVLIVISIKNLVNSSRISSCETNRKSHTLLNHKDVWECNSCSNVNDADAEFCTNCGAACSSNENSSVQNNSDTLAIGWSCPKCNNMNSYYDYHCPVCNSKRPSSITRPVSTTEKSVESSWICVKCKTINAPKATKCAECGEKRTENSVLSSVADNEKKKMNRVRIVVVCIIAIIGSIVFLVFNLSKPNSSSKSNTSSYSSSSKPTVRVANFVGFELDSAVTNLKRFGAGDSSVKYYYPYYYENGKHIDRSYIESGVAQFFSVKNQYVKDGTLYLECSCSSRISGVMNSGLEKSVIRKKIAEVYGNRTANSVMEIVFGV